MMQFPIFTMNVCLKTSERDAERADAFIWNKSISRDIPPAKEHMQNDVLGYDV